jgi:putative membrane protein
MGLRGGINRPAGSTEGPWSMKKDSALKRIAKGAAAGLVAGFVASWAANQFHSLWSVVAGEEQNPEVARLSDQGGRPDTAAAKEDVAAGGLPNEDATVAIATKVSKVIFERSLTKKEKHQAGVAVHYAFGAASGALYGAVAEVVPSTSIGRGAGFGTGIWLIAVELVLPAIGLARRPQHYPLRMHAYSFISHLVYGAVTERVRKTLRSAL